MNLNSTLPSFSIPTTIHYSTVPLDFIMIEQNIWNNSLVSSFLYWALFKPGNAHQNFIASTGSQSIFLETSITYLHKITRISQSQNAANFFIRVIFLTFLLLSNAKIRLARFGFFSYIYFKFSYIVSLTFHNFT